MNAVAEVARDVDVRVARPLVPNAVLGMVLCLVTEVMLFTGLIAAYLVVRSKFTNWPPMGQEQLPIVVTVVNTFILLFSGLTMILAVRHLRAGKSPTALLWMTCIAGSTFLVIQGYEWAKIINYGVTIGSSLYGATFYTLIGVHALHVIIAVIALFCVCLRSKAYTVESHDGLLAMRLYWLFVVSVWPVLFVLVYLW